MTNMLGGIVIIALYVSRLAECKVSSLNGLKMTTEDLITPLRALRRILARRLRHFAPSARAFYCKLVQLEQEA